jgi:hypothetical protein
MLELTEQYPPPPTSNLHEILISEWYNGLFEATVSLLPDTTILESFR